MPDIRLQSNSAKRLPDPKALHARLLAHPNALLVLRAPSAPPRPAPGQPGVASEYVPATPEIFLAILHDPDAPSGWRALAFNGHVDLGTGIRTALAQIVAEELDIELNQLEMVLGHTEAVPNQGPTIASATIQISAIPLRRAAAQARQQLLNLAAARWQLATESLHIQAGVVYSGTKDSTTPVKRASYGDLLEGHCLHLPLQDQVSLKPSSQYRLVGQVSHRVDIPAKACGALTFVHDVRLPGMRHGRVIRPPYAGRDSGDYVSHSLLEVDPSSVAHLPGQIQLVVKADFVGIVADREEQAIAAMRALKLRWRTPPALCALNQPAEIEQALRSNTSIRRVLRDDGNTSKALLEAHLRRRRSYVWPYQMHASIGPSCAVADFKDEQLTVWSGTQNPHMLRTDLARLVDLGEDQIEVVRMEAAGCYGRNCADDVAGDAALLAIAVGAPVRLQLTREQEHLWEPKGAAQLIDVDAGLDVQGQLLAYDIAVSYPSNDAPLLALLLTGRQAARARTLEMGDRTALPPYRSPHLHAVCHDMPPLVRASWLRGVSALPNTFAHESMMDELAQASATDPLEFRLRHLDDERACELLKATAERAHWHAGELGSRGQADRDGMLHGRGLAYARYIHSRFPGFGAAWSAWVVDLTVDSTSGRIRLQHLVVGQDTGMMINPDGVRHQLHGNVIQSLSRALIEQVSFDEQGVASREWGTYPIIGFTDLPSIDVVLMPRQDQPPMGAGESASLPCAAALANAIFDATGLRLCSPPFTPEVLRQAWSNTATPVPA